MGFFNKQATPQTPVMKYNTARSNLLLVVAFTAINLVLQVIESDMYFVFSASIPLFLTVVGGELAILMETEAPYITSIVAAVAIIGIYLLCYFLSKKARGWMIGALVLFSLDSLFLLLNFSADAVIDLLFHAWVLYYLILGVVNGGKVAEQSELPVQASVETAGEPQPAPQPIMVNGEPVDTDTPEQ